MERGTYTWNAATGTFTHSVATDTNGEWGLSHSEIDNVWVQKGIIGSPTIVLQAGIENLDLSATGELAINATGNAAANVLTGNAGNNVLNGGAGADTLIGAGGDDLYVLDQAGDVVVEEAGEGSDTVRIAYSIPATIDLNVAYGGNVENVVIAGTGAFNVTGNAADNRLTGNASANTLIGGDGNDTLDGSAGNDVMIGGDGDDVYVVNAAGDVVTEEPAQGEDEVRASISYTLGANLENLTLTGTAAINGTGNELDNLITGNAAANLIDGGAGADRMIGGAGNDIYVVDHAEDVVTEALNGGTDTVRSSISFDLAADAPNVEHLVLLEGAGDIDGAGNDAANVITGNSGANVLSGGAGNDRLVGGAGDDVFVVGEGTDTVVEAAGQGNDTVQSHVSFSLAALAEVENLELTGSGNVNATGNGKANELTGNSGNNVLSGAAGNDTLDGGEGNDTLMGGAGNDTLHGGEGEDRFVFNTAPNAATNLDTIEDFEAGDKLAFENAIYLGLAAGPLAADRFVVGSAAGDANDRFIYNDATGALYYDANGSAAGGQVQVATLLGTPTLSFSDFDII